MSKRNKQVKINEAIPSLNNEGKPINPIKRVAIYCRANNNHLGQNISYLSAIEEYEKKVTSNSNWKLIDIYSEEVKSTIRWQKRLELNRMLQACENGEIDLIVTPSFSRISYANISLIYSVFNIVSTDFLTLSTVGFLPLTVLPLDLCRSFCCSSSNFAEVLSFFRMIPCICPFSSSGS